VISTSDSKPGAGLDLDFSSLLGGAAPAAAPTPAATAKAPTEEHTFLKPLDSAPVTAAPTATAVPVMPIAEDELPPIPSESSVARPVLNMPPIELASSPPPVTDLQRRGWTPNPNASTMQAPTAPAGNTSPTGITTIPLEQLESALKLSSNQNFANRALIGGWQNLFDQVMIFSFVQNTLSISAANERWKNKITIGEKVALDTPSIFKIVVDTSHPYHGYVVPGSINEAFFKLANGGEYPQHVTLIPLVRDGHFEGIIMGCCTQVASRSLILEKLEHHGKLFADTLARFATPKQKAG